jgi:segregation and condensation protein A
LLYLIKKFELDIYDIPIAKITQEYLNYLELMKELNLDIAGEFLVMASTLINIKSKMLLPRPEGETDAVEENPLEELQRRLLEYKRYKEASQLLEEREILDYDVFNRPAEPAAAPPPLSEEKVDVTLFELVSALKHVIGRLPAQKSHEVFRETISLTQRIYEVIDRLKGQGRVEFEDLFADAKTRPLVIVTFLSILELLKRRLVRAQQALPGAIIHIFPVGDFDELGNTSFDDDYGGGAAEEPEEQEFEDDEAYQEDA